MPAELQRRETRLARFGKRRRRWNARRTSKRKRKRRGSKRG